MLSPVTVDMFSLEVANAMKAYEKYVVCIDKTPADFQPILTSLLEKAINAYQTRAPHLRHGIALDRHLTIILSQNDSGPPFCGIYFNLHSPYQTQMLAQASRGRSGTVGGHQPQPEA